MMIFRAARDIRKDEELLFNYNGSGGLSEFRDRYPFIKGEQ
jgi:SET domain-containing protein